MTEAELLALGEAIYNAQPSELDGGAPIHFHPQRDAILRAWATAVAKALYAEPILRVTADKKGLLIACGKQSVTLPPSALAATLADIAGGETASKAAPAVDKALRKNAAAASYDTDAREIARVLVRHYGDEAEAVLDRVPSHIVHVRLKPGKR